MWCVVWWGVGVGGGRCVVWCDVVLGWVGGSGLVVWGWVGLGVEWGVMLRCVALWHRVVWFGLVWFGLGWVGLGWVGWC